MTQDEWRSTVNARLSSVEVKLSHLETSDAVDKVHRETIEKRLTGIEDNTKWLIRLVIGALILGLITFVIGGGFVIPS